MFAVSVCQSVCLSRGSSRLHCAKMAKQIEILFGVNTFEGPWNIVLDVGLDPPQTGKVGALVNFRSWDPLLSPDPLKLGT